MVELAGPTGMELPTVTVIILASSGSVGATLESVLAQDYANFNCILLEDETIVGLARAAAPCCTESSDRLSILPRKSGYDCDTLNDAWRQATGDYVAIVCSGDSFRTNWLSACVSFMEANPETIVGYPDWILADGQGNVLRNVQAPDYDFHKMVLHPSYMPSPGALIRRSVVAMPTLRNRSFRVANGYETWLLLALQGDFIRIPTISALRRDDRSRLGERVAEYCRASNTLFTRANLPKAVYTWRRSASVHLSFFCAMTVIPENKWTALRFLVLAFLSSPRAALLMFLDALAKNSSKLTNFGIPILVCRWIGHIAEHSLSARRNSAS
jgi:glycosyltransferase involved in cell wall biosynthesis